MAKRYYPAVLEKAEGETLAVWFPDFPDCVAAGTSQEAVLEKAETALALAVASCMEQDRPLPAPSAVEAIMLPPECEFLAFVVLGVEPPDPSERVNIYLPKSLIAKADRRANELGMSRSSFFGFAVSSLLGPPELKFGSARGGILAALSPKPPKR